MVAGDDAAAAATWAEKKDASRSRVIAVLSPSAVGCISFLLSLLYWVVLDCMREEVSLFQDPRYAFKTRALTGIRRKE